MPVWYTGEIDLPYTEESFWINSVVISFSLQYHIDNRNLRSENTH